MAPPRNLLCRFRPSPWGRVLQLLRQFLSRIRAFGAWKVGCMQAASHRGIGAVESRHDFARAAIATDPTERAVGAAISHAEIGDERGEAVARYAAGHRAVAARRQPVRTVHDAIGELDVVVAIVAEAPMRAVADEREALRRVLP